jgi:AcrR family transcriptional regulator
MTQAPVSDRKKPSQLRAETTVDTILEATAQILERGDVKHFTTNHIAERAGYSVGTLYSYFQNKQSLLRAIAQREIARQERDLLTHLSDVEKDHSDEDIIRTVVRSAVRPFGNRSALRLAIMKQLMGDSEIMAATEKVQKNVMHAFFALMSMRHQRRIALDSESRFTLLASIAGAMQTTIANRPDIFGSPRFEDDIVAIVQGFMDRHLAEPLAL